MAFDDYLGAERARIQQQPQAPAYMFRDDRNAELDRAQGAQTAAMTAAAKGPFAPQQPGAGFEGFSKDLEAGAPAAKAPGSNPFAPADTKGMVSGAISRLLQNPTGGFDQQTALARQNAIKANQQANEDMRTQAALQFLPGTGQNLAPMQQQTDAQRLAMRDFDLQAAGGRAQAEQQGLQTGISAGLQQEGQRISAEQAARQLAETQRQFNETLPIQAAQARTAAELGQGQLDISRGQLGVQQGQLDLSKTLGLGNLSLAQQQVANQVSQFASEMDFKKYALQAGMDQHTADLTWQANQAEVDRKWKTGERLSSQDFTTLINKTQQDFEGAQNNLNRVLQMDLQGNAQKFQDAQTKAAQAFDAAMQQNGFNHDAAMQTSQQVFQQEMQQAGFTHEQAMQAAQLAAQANLAKQQMQLQETLHMADLAQSDHQFGERIGLDYAQLQQSKVEFQANLAQNATQFAKEFGLKEEQVNKAMASDDFQNTMERIQIGLDLTKNNPAAMEPFAQQLARTMGKALGLSDQQIEAGISSGALLPKPTNPNTAPTHNSLAEELDNIGSDQASLDKWASLRGSNEVDINGKPVKVVSIWDSGTEGFGRMLVLNVGGAQVYYDPHRGTFGTQSSDPRLAFNTHSSLDEAVAAAKKGQ